MFAGEHVIQIRESKSCVGVCESRAHAVLNQSSGGSFPSYAISVAFALWNFLLHAAKKNNNAATARVIWLCACVRYWPGCGLVYVCPLL